jgi:hypothetical protein
MNMSNPSARFLWSLLAVSLGTLLPTLPARAQGDTGQESFSVASNGQQAPVRKGFFAQTALGGFATFGGAQSYSNMEAFLAIGLGFDFFSDFSAAFQFQLAPSAQNCYAPDGTTSPPGCATPTQPSSGSNTFTMAALDAVLSYRIQLVERLFVPIRIFGGMANFSPLPINNLACSSSNPHCSILPANAAGDIWEPTLGGATGLEYATGFEHFTISLEASVRDIPFLSAFALSIYPQVKYTF